LIPGGVKKSFFFSITLRTALGLLYNTYWGIFPERKTGNWS
jgi:hypothetical protein